MVLHRDIYWLGRQWAVTGFGIQACDQKQKGQFDIEASRLWEDGVQERVRAQKWFNAEDFEKAVSAARKYHPELPRNVPPPEIPVPPPKENLLPPKPPEPLVGAFKMQVKGLRARLQPVWRIRDHGGGRRENP